MNQQRVERLGKASLMILGLFILWALIGVIFWPIKVTSFWGIGLGVVAAVFYVICLYLPQVGIKKTVQACLSIFAVIIGAALLNVIRGWPYGFVTYHDILGWKIFSLAWPVPVFWFFLNATVLLLMRPQKMANDPKILFAWAFDTAFAVMILSLVVEPIMAASTAEAWSMQGSFLGVPLNCFIGWFVSSFVASAAAILIAKLWQIPDRPKHYSIFVILGALALLGLMTAKSLGLVPVMGLSIIILVYLGTWAGLIFYRRSKAPKPEIIASS
ncbi:MAG: carotenoid biosynthesis protein [Patescibacteria group bacterium]|nr:carotenoid biosynthesis protein [Patescibacteria group bacterium]